MLVDGAPGRPGHSPLCTGGEGPEHFRKARPCTAAPSGDWCLEARPRALPGKPSFLRDGRRDRHRAGDRLSYGVFAPSGECQVPQSQEPYVLPAAQRPTQHEAKVRDHKPGSCPAQRRDGQRTPGGGRASKALAPSPPPAEATACCSRPPSTSGWAASHSTVCSVLCSRQSVSQLDTDGQHPGQRPQHSAHAHC